jgi:hypothetical protein
MADFYDHSVKTAVAETRQPNPLSAGGEGVAALRPRRLRCRGSFAATGFIANGGRVYSLGIVNF